jgi:hypothetical protein
LIRVNAWCARIRNAPPGTAVHARFGNRIVNDGQWAVPIRYRDMGDWRFYAYWVFWKPWARLWGVRWGMVLAWGRLPADWFEHT